MSVVTASKDNFEKEVLKNDGVTFVDFYADWCGPCKMTSPIIDDLAESDKYKDKIKFVKVDVDKNQELAGKYGVFSIPTFIAFKGGEPVSQFTGAKDKGGFETELDKVTS